MTPMRAIAAVLVLAAANATGAAWLHAQVAVSQPSDSVRTITPASASEATALGIKLLGVFDDSTGQWIENAVVRDLLGHEARTSRAGVAALNVLTPWRGITCSKCEGKDTPEVYPALGATPPASSWPGRRAARS